MRPTPEFVYESAFSREPKGPIAIAPLSLLASSSSRHQSISDRIAQSTELFANHRIQLRSLSHLLSELRRQPFHLFVERLVVIVHSCSADIAPRCQNETVFGNLRQLHGTAETRHIGVGLARTHLAIGAPAVHRVGDARYILVVENSV